LDERVFLKMEIEDVGVGVLGVEGGVNDSEKVELMW